MKKFLKWTGIILGTLVILLAGAYTAVYFSTESRMNKLYSVKVEPLEIPTDAATLIKGAHLTDIRACRECHGANLAGNIMLDDPALGRLVAPNLTKGKGGLRADFKTEDWIRAIRHAVRSDGKPYRIMPAHELRVMSDEDVQAIIAYCQSLPPIDNVLPEAEIGPLARVLTALDKIPLLPAEMFDHNQDARMNVQPAANAEYGGYLGIMCINCHREDYKGGDHPVPGKPPVPGIDGNSRIAKLTFEEFSKVLITGIAPDGHQMNPEDMPWKITRNFNETELRALFMFLKVKNTNSESHSKLLKLWRNSFKKINKIA
jgi:mono/diheme cytochrome c family protein